MQRKHVYVKDNFSCRQISLPEIWDKMAEIMLIIIHYGDQIRL